MKKLTAFDHKTGCRYSIRATNIRHMGAAPAPTRASSSTPCTATTPEVEDCVRTNKAMGLANLPSQSWQINTGWMLAANLAADLDTWLRLLTLHNQGSLEDAEPDTMRLRFHHLPARLARHARCRILRIERTSPWAAAFTVSWNRLTRLPVATCTTDLRPTTSRKEEIPQPPACGTRRTPRRHVTAHPVTAQNITGEQLNRSATETRWRIEVN
ncbi:transposase [Streptomyces regalis]|uniref:transposase n=1 Tax=Streptomyces regalis TaxID=68262 RepID=UPI001FCA07F0|nr:transposase [Streptomyces regalis]